jgi:hypothetical protein
MAHRRRTLNHKNKIRQTSMKVLGLKRKDVKVSWRSSLNSISLLPCYNHNWCLFYPLLRPSSTTTWLLPLSRGVTFHPAPLPNAGSHYQSRTAGHQLCFYQSTSKMETEFSTRYVRKPSPHKPTVCQRTFYLILSPLNKNNKTGGTGWIIDWSTALQTGRSLVWFLMVSL